METFWRLAFYYRYLKESSYKSVFQTESNNLPRLFNCVVSHPYPNPLKVVQAIMSSIELFILNKRQNAMHSYAVLFALGKQSQVWTVSRKSAAEMSPESAVGGSYLCQGWMLR